MIQAKVAEFIPDVDLEGQWSLDIMQNGDEFYVIDMATACNSMFYQETVPENKRKDFHENWLPDLGKQDM